MSDVEAFFRAFHAAQPGITSQALARAGSYERLAARVPPAGRVLDLGCGDEHLIARIGERAVGLDLAPVPSGRIVRGRAQCLPFRGGAFACVTCHLAFMLLDDLEQAVAELARVLASGGAFLAVVGGGPAAHGDEDTDAFHAFASLLWSVDPAARSESAPLHPRPAARGFGDRRASTEAGWCELFAGWDVAPFERWELDLSGSFEDVWRFLGASYQLPASEAPRVREQLRALPR